MNDKLLHFLVGAAMAAGLGKEYGDRCAIGNHWDWLDLAADLGGAVVGAALILLVMHNL